jgi:hypothetical protein
MNQPLFVMYVGAIKLYCSDTQKYAGSPAGGTSGGFAQWQITEQCIYETLISELQSVPFSTGSQNA